MYIGGPEKEFRECEWEEEQEEVAGEAHKFVRDVREGGEREVRIEDKLEREKGEDKK